MTIILFLVDTSSSMCQKAYVNGVQKSYLDIAKGAVEIFLKYRQRTQDCLGDRYMLLTFEEPPANIKAGWKENHATFMNELKNLQSTGLTSMGESLKNAFDLLNLNRMQSGIDTYGQGRCPFYLEPSVIIVLTDGGRYSHRNGVHQDIILPLNSQIPGTKFTKEPFRWDQRLFSLVLRMTGNKIDERVDGKVPHDDSPIERMCEVTGGRSYRIRSHYVLNQCIESLVQKVQPGVVLQFEPLLPKDPNLMGNDTLQDIIFQPVKKMIYVQKHIPQKTFPIGFWPLPESYWPEMKSIVLPPRDAHPKLKVVTTCVEEPQLVHNFPVDKYEVEASMLTMQILQKRDFKKCWQVIISNGMHGFELPFGYLKASNTTSQVHLYVLAYNYPALLPLLHDLIHKYNMNPPNDLMYKFNAYVRSIPSYYCPFLRKALLTISVPYQLLQFLLPENIDNYLSPSIANHLKHIKNTAKQDQENLCLKVYKQLKQPKPPYRQIETAKLNPGIPLRRDLVRHPLLRDTFSKLHAEIEPLENYTIVVPQLTRQISAKSYRNPFDIPRRDIIEEIGRMREAFYKPQLASLTAKDSGHCFPIAEMGNYQEYLKNKDNPLREIEPTNVRQHMFGNPYKKDKHMVMVDEADLGEVAPMKGGNAGNTSGNGTGNVVPLGKKVEVVRPRKRKAGPIRMDYIFRRTSTDSRPGTPSSSCSMSSLTSSRSSFSDCESDDSSSEISQSSNRTSGDGNSTPLVVNFPDFPDEETTDNYFPLNGYVRDFINGVGAESNCDNAKIGLPQSALQPGVMMNGTSPHINPQQHHIVLPPAASIHQCLLNYGAATDSSMSNPPASPNVIHPSVGPALLQQQQPANGGNFSNLQMNAIGNTANIVPASSALPNYQQYSAHLHTSQHNNMNDAQEISRILQQCHNSNGNNHSNTTDVIVNDENVKLVSESVLMAPPVISSISNTSNTTCTVSAKLESVKREPFADSNGSTNHCNNVLQNHVEHTRRQPLTEEQRQQARKHNLDLRAQIFRDIRRPGRNYSQLLDHLNLVKGDLDMKSNFVQMCITESQRFRRKQMVDSIQEWWKKKQHQLQTSS